MSHMWMLRALCRTADVNPELFDDEDETALAYCQRCPVRVECLDYALTLVPHPMGVWGGTTYDERRGVKRGGHRRSCPGCGGKEIYNDGAAEICVSCGLTWST